MIKPKAVSKLFSLRLSGFSLFKRSVSFLPDALVISLSFFVFETIGITRSGKGSISTSLGFSTSTTLFSLNLSIVKSPPNSTSLCRCGALFYGSYLIEKFTTHHDHISTYESTAITPILIDCVCFHATP